MACCFLRRFVDKQRELRHWVRGGCESYEVGEQCCDLFFDQALLDASHGRDMLTFKYSSFGVHQVRRHRIAVPRVEVIDTSTIMANLQVWAPQLRAISPATSSMMSMDRLATEFGRLTRLAAMG